MKTVIRQRVQEQSRILKPQQFAGAIDETDFVEKFVRRKFTEMLGEPDRKRMLLEKVLGWTFRARHPESAKEIDAAFDAYSLESLDRYHVTLNCIMTAMFYFYAPLCKIAVPDSQPRKILGRGFSDQLGNLADEKYVQSALLCARLLTRDAGMSNVMAVFKACGLWNGETVFIESGKNLLGQIPLSLV